MEIQVVSAIGGGAPIKVNLEPQDSVAKLKAMVAKEKRIPASTVIVVFRGQQLDEAESLKAVGMGDGDKCYLIVRTEGGFTKNRWLTIADTDRYHRQKLIPDWNQQSLSDANILILGVGALGSYVASNLALSGCGKLILVDFDTIELSNLNRQLLFTSDDIGKNKAETAKEKLEILNPDIEIIAFPEAMEKMPKKLLNGVTIIAGCLDSFRGRRWSNSLALREKIPLVSGGMFAFMGQVQTILPYDTACFECQPLISQEKLSQACSPLGTTRKEMDIIKQDAPLPSVSSLSSIIGGLITQEILKLTLSIDKTLDNYLFYDGLSNTFTILKLAKNKNCPICGSKYQLESAPVLVFKEDTLDKLKTRIAHAFGMADPRIMLRGKFLTSDSDLNLKENDKIIILDERLASPISLIVNFENP